MKLKLAEPLGIHKSSCYVHTKGLNNRNRAKLVPVENVSKSTVTCGNVSLSSNIYEVGVIYGNNIKSLKTCLNRYLQFHAVNSF